MWTNWTIGKGQLRESNPLPCFRFQDDYREHHNSLPKKTVISIDHPDEPTRVVVFNSHARRRSEVVTFHINMPNIKVIAQLSSCCRGGTSLGSGSKARA